MYQPIYQHRRPKRMGSYFLPFLSIIILGLIGVLVFQIVGYFREKSLAALENKAAVKIVAGRADMKIWGVDQWANAVDGSILNEGDEIKTAPGSRVVLTLLNGSVMRLNSETDVELTGLKSQDGEDQAAFTLRSGELWLKHSEKDTVKSTFTVSTPNMNVQALGTTFDVVQSTDQQAVHVIEGKVKVDFLVQDGDAQKTRTADSLEVALGQEVSLGSQQIADLQNRKPIDVLALLSDEFRNTEWFTWNRAQDTNGTAGVSVSDAVNANQNGSTIPGIGENGGTTPNTPTPTTPEVTQLPTGPLSAPTITSPTSSDRTTKTGTVTITGTVDPRTSKLEVKTYDLNGKPDPYILSKYAAGSTTWSYIASKDFGNLRAGDNQFTITSIDADGVRSESTNITISYDKPKVESDLSAPKVNTFNDGNSSNVNVDSVKVSGTVGKGIEKLYINGFALTKYTAGDTNWFYFAKTSYGNLRDGENTYEVYGVDADGKKTPVTSFTITKVPFTPPSEPPAQIPPQTETPSL